MSPRSPHLHPERVAFLESGVNGGEMYREIAVRYTRKFKTPISKAAISGLVERGTIKLTAEFAKKRNGRRLSNRATKDRFDEIVRRAKNGESPHTIGAAVGMTTHGVRGILRKLGVPYARYNGARLAVVAERKSRRHNALPPAKRPKADPPKDDPIADIGISFMELGPRSCRYPVARDPKDKALRFCGGCVVIQFIHGKRRVSSWCEQHRAVVFRCDATLVPQQVAAE